MRAEVVLDSAGCKGLSPTWQPTVLAPGPALPLTYHGFGPLNLSFPICKLRALKDMISISSMNIFECPLCAWPSEGSEMDVLWPNPFRRESEGPPIYQAPITCLISYSHRVITLHYNSQIHAILHDISTMLFVCIAKEQDMCELQSLGSLALELERPGFPFWFHLSRSTFPFWTAIPSSVTHNIDRDLIQCSPFCPGVGLASW